MRFILLCCTIIWANTLEAKVFVPFKSLGGVVVDSGVNYFNPPTSLNSVACPPHVRVVNTRGQEEVNFAVCRSIDAFLKEFLWAGRCLSPRANRPCRYFISGRREFQSVRIWTTSVNGAARRPYAFNDGGRLPVVFKVDDKTNTNFALLRKDRCCNRSCVDIRSVLLVPDVPSDFDRLLSRLIGETCQMKRPPKQTSAYKYKKRGNPSGPFHAVSSFVHSLRGVGHTLLGDKVPVLIFVSFGFALLCGEGAFRVFDDPNRNARSRSVGWLFLLGGGFAGLICFVLGVAGA